MAFHIFSLVRIYREGMPYSKLLNYFVMRTLDTNYLAHISATELHHFLLVLGPLVHHLLLASCWWGRKRS